MKISACVLAVAAGAALAGSALAQGQAVTQSLDSMLPQTLRLSTDGSVTVVDSGYSSRAEQNAYISGLGAFNGLIASAIIYEDARLSPFNGTLYPIVQLNSIIGIPATTTETAAQVRITFYDNHSNVDAPPFPGTGQIGEPIVIAIPAGAIVPPATGAAGLALEFTFPEVLSDDDRVSVKFEILNGDGTAPHPTIRPVIVAPANITLGSSLVGLYADLEPAGAPDGEFDGPWIFNGNPTSAFNMTIVVDFPVPPPANATDLGLLTACLTNTQSVNLAAGDVKWFRFEVPAGGIVAADLDALTIDTETPGSTSDSVLALYDNRGNIVAVDDDDGSADLSQLSFGIGRWNGPGDGLPYDGRNGALAEGVYYLAVTSFGAGLFFDDAFSVTPGVSLAATYDLNVNLYETSCLPTLVAPTPDVDLGTITAPSAFPAGLDLTTGIRWYKFNVCTEVSEPAKFLDFDFSPSAGDLVAIIFDANGNEIALSDDADALPDDGIDYLLPQFSFGNVGPRLAGGEGLGSVTLAGQDGTLPAGDYYMAVAGFPFAVLPEAASITNGRFFFFGTALDATALSSPFITTDVNIEDCDPVSSCPSCAADYDQDGGVTGGDLAAFFADFESGAACADVDADGGVTGGDLGTFFFFFEQGGC